MKKYKLIITILSVILVLLVVLAVFIWSRDSSDYLYDPSNFFGTWEAVECVSVGKMQQIDFVPEKYIGHRIHISANSFYMDFWEGIIPELSVILWKVDEMGYDEYLTLNTHYEEPILVNDDNRFVLKYIAERRIKGDVVIIDKDEVGFIIDNDTLICATSSGWYRYEKID